MFSYQNEGADFLAHRDYAGLFDGMRLGKTRQFLKAAKKIGAETICVVAKASGVYVWEQESLEWGFDPIILKAKDKPLAGRFNILSYNALISDLHSHLMSARYDLIGGDESDAFKNFKAKRTKAFYGPKMDQNGGLVSRSNRVWLMTGTPVLNHPAELYPMIRALFPDTIMKNNDRVMTYWDFVNRYCTTVDNGFGIQIVGGKNLSKLRDQMRGRTLRRTKKDVWEDWKEPLISMLPIKGNVTGIPSEEMAAVRKALKSKSDITNALQSVAEQAPTLRRLTGIAKVEGVVRWVDDNIEQAGKIIIFAHHREVLDLVRSKLKHKYVQIVGGMSQKEKFDAYTAFQEDENIKIFIGQNQAARDSIPLWKASTTISIEPDWVPGNNDQMMDRMSHFSKKEPCVCYYATLVGSIDEDIQRANTRKREITSELGLN
jgi:SNF2 family DNA or RNA helicase